MNFPLFNRPRMPDDLEADIASADEANVEQDTLAIDAQVEIGIRAVAKLDAFCDNRYRDEAALLGAWKSASHLQLRRVHPRRPATPSVPQAA